MQRSTERPPDPLYVRSQFGAAAAGTNQVSITVEGEFRVIRANGLPDHATGQFPGRNNPNRMSAQSYDFRVPLKPQVAAKTTALGMYPFGVAVNGVVFDPGAAEWWRGDRDWQYEPLFLEGKLGADQSNAHVQPTGAYHYHAIPTALLDRLAAGKAGPVLVGWAADGFPIYGPWDYSDAKNTNSALKKMKSSYRVKQGARSGGPGGKYDGTFLADFEYVAGSGDLDECNGRFGVTREFPEGTYHYVLTEDWPFIPRLFRGTPSSSFFRHGPPGGQRFGGPGGPKGPPPKGFPPPRPFNP
ncbi:MAG: YHYH protein [Verrucomicrobia bacterium]|nr:YHYH protein [Verrucomicrobiota bacterium]